MDVNPDFRDLFSALNVAGARYLVVGAYAVAYHSEPRYTKDLDIWVDPSAENAPKVWEALHRFAAPLQGIAPEDFADPNTVFYMGREPNRIDILAGVEALTFADAWKGRVRTRYGEELIHILGRRDLLRNKRALARDQDLMDVNRLERFEKHRARRRSRNKRKRQS